jgi:hypothetical protein
MADEQKNPGRLATRLALIAWIVYSVASGIHYWYVATGGGVLLCAASLFEMNRWGTAKLMDWISLAFFVTAAIIMIGLHSAAFPIYHVVVIWSFFAVAGWASVARGAPFTEAYAREASPREFWDNPVFRRFNWILTLFWCGLLTVNVGLAAISVHVGGNFGRLVPGFLIPTGLFILGLVFSKRFPNYYFGRSSIAPVAPQAVSTG